MKNALIYAGVLLAFLLMVTDTYWFTWALILFAVGAGTAEWSKRFKS